MIRNCFYSLFFIFIPFLYFGCNQPDISDQEKLYNEYSTWLDGYYENLKWKSYDREMKLNKEILTQSFNEGNKYLLNNQKPEGNFNYQYNFVTKELDNDDNQVRQAGAVWGLSLNFQYRQDPEVKAALDKSLKFFFSNTEIGLSEDSLFINYPGQYASQTGTVALISLAIIEYLRTEKAGNITLDEAYKQELMNYLKGYIEHLKDMQFPNKRFSQFILMPSKTKYPKSSPYFDGETLLCFVKAAKYLGFTELIPIIEETSIQLAKYYTMDQLKTEPDPNLTKAFFQWSCMAFWEYQDAKWANYKLYRKYVVSMGWWMIHAHHTLRRTRNTGYAYEGIIHAYLIAKEDGNKKALNDFENTIDIANYKLLSWQVNGPLSSANKFLRYYKIDDKLANGGFMNHKREPLLRVDVTQHQMHAIILALRHIYR